MSTRTGTTTMTELEIQSRVIAAVKKGHGVAEKISHKYIKGVCDLLIKLVDHPALLAEVKIHPRLVDATKPISLEVTTLQRKFLYRFDAAGMQTCVISFLHGPVKNYQIREYWIGVFPAHQESASTDEHTFIQQGSFDARVLLAIESYLMTEARG